jgi:N-sulfoglucosamine sulfohydrolase
MARAVLSALAFVVVASTAYAETRPNIVWIVTEDISPNLGCYGDPDAITPNLDRFATQGARFQRAFTHCPVCAPTRSGLITGQYPTTIGSHHMRSKLINPPGLFTDELKKAGYAVFWPGKTDFNFDVPKGWADTRDWTRNPDLLPKDKPFFAYINFTITHESQIRANPQTYQKNTATLTAAERRDPATVKLPPYYPDEPEVRRNVATYHENITAMDKLVGGVLKTLDDRKLTDNTLVIFFGDHGWGMSRGKRWCYDSGTRAPLIVRWPGKIRPGSVREDVVAFLDLTYSTVAATGAPVPERFQGQDVLTEKQTPREFAFSFRDRMDETYDRIRSVRSEKYRYVKNFHPELPYAQWINYMDEMPTMKVWRKRAFEGTLNPAQMAFFARTKPAEELYDLSADPHEIRNLAADPAHAKELARHRAALEKWIVETKDLGAVPEKELIAKGLVKDLLGTEYEERIRLHPMTSPVP